MAKKPAPKALAKATAPAPSKDEQIGFHKGSLMTLSKERSELVRILGIVEQLVQMHATALKELGVELDAAQGQQPAPAQKRKPPIEDIL